MLRHYIEVVAFWVQGRNVQLLTLMPIISMIVIRAKYRYMLPAQNLGDASTQRCLSGSAISHNSQDDMTRDCSNRCIHLVLQLLALHLLNQLSHAADSPKTRATFRAAYML